jgi:Mrp family chromosome partitioning ATPase
LRDYSGPIPPNPSELLSSRRFSELIEGFRKDYDKIIIDTPPINSVTDALVVSALPESSVIFVVHGGVTTKEMVRDAREMLKAINTKIIGAVLNNVKVDRPGYRHYSYYYHYYRHHYRYYGNEEEKMGKKEHPIRTKGKKIVSTLIDRKNPRGHRKS